MSNYREETYGFLGRLIAAPENNLEALAARGIASDAVWDLAHPINRLEGIDAILDGFVRPLRRALSHVRRRDEIFIGGDNRRGPGQDWVASVTHYVGNFTGPLCGIAPTNSLVFLRSGEFYKIDDGKIVEAKLIVDFLDLMRQAQCFPLPRELGTEMLFPAPATHDGVLPGKPDNGKKSLDIVEGMLGDLMSFDPETFESKGQTGSDGYWHDDMLWYGPGGIGTNYRWSGFEKDHRAPFLTAFPDRVGGNHYCRIGDGNYAAVSGWPSMTMTLMNDYLGVKAENQKLTLRVMDFYRCADGQIRENWVLLDYGELFHQLGINLFAKAAAMQSSKK